VIQPNGATQTTKCTTKYGEVSMKRTLPKTSKTSKRNTVALDTRRLTTVRGGTDLGIAVEAVEPPPSFMQQQHNETLIRL
jgi:hypothetical protein